MTKYQLQRIKDLERLARLKRDGVLNDSEFEAEKSKLLNEVKATQEIEEPSENLEHSASSRPNFFGLGITGRLIAGSLFVLFIIALIESKPVDLPSATTNTPVAPDIPTAQRSDTEVTPELSVLTESVPVSPSKSNVQTGNLPSSAQTVSNSTQKVIPSPMSAEDQWDEFRNDENKYIGTRIKWLVQIDVVFNPSIPNSPPWAYVNGNGGRCVLYDEQGNAANALTNSFPPIHSDDWFIIAGKFEGINSDGFEEIVCSKMVRTKPPN